MRVESNEEQRVSDFGSVFGECGEIEFVRERAKLVNSRILLAS